MDFKELAKIAILSSTSTPEEKLNVSKGQFSLVKKKTNCPSGKNH